jgi:hypothetical protein
MRSARKKRTCRFMGMSSPMSGMPSRSFSRSSRKTRDDLPVFAQVMEVLLHVLYALGE